jgi:hypothetical protein
MKKTVLGLSGVTAVSLLSFWLSCGISGRVFLVSADGKPLFSPGAQILIFRSSSTNNMGAFLESPKFESLRDEYFQKLNLNAANYPPEIVDNLNQLAATNFCLQTYAEALKFFGRSVATLKTDDHGRFSTRLRPGTYSILAWGQAGRQNSIWLDSVQVNWRSDATVSDSICNY